MDPNAGATPLSPALATGLAVRTALPCPMDRVDCSIVTHVSPRGLLVPSLVFLALRECICFLGDQLSRAFEFQSSVSSASVISSRRKAKDQAMLLGMDRLGGPVFRLFFSHLL